MSQTEFVSKIRIAKIELKNFKGVKNGSIDFNCLKNPLEKETRSDILGLYGQNGSGKTTLLEAIHLAKLAMMGEEIPTKKFGNIISKDTESARMSITFQISNPDNSFYYVEYAFSLGYIMIPNEVPSQDKNKKELINGLAGSIGAIASISAATTLAPIIPGAAIVGAAGIVANQILKSASSNKDVSTTTGTTKRMVIYDEVLSLSGMFQGTSVRFGPIFDASSKESVFLPKARQKSYFPKKTAAAMKEVQKYKERSLLNAQSLIFGNDLSQLLLEQEFISEYSQIILDLKVFAIQKIRVLDSRLIGPSSDEIIPLFTAHRGIAIRKSDSTAFLSEEGLKTLQIALSALNIVLKQLIPGLTLEAVRQVDIDLDDKHKARSKRPGTKVTIYSVRDNVRIPLTEESTGILRLISALGLFSYAFVNEGVTVAIDEIDSGVYEYLLGELLLIFEEYGVGQLLFTCHNLRPMEVLDKKYIYFTTTNPENRYLKPKNIRNENNLRDVYLREIVMGGQEEDLYSTAKHGKIAAALQKAGEILGEE